MLNKIAILIILMICKVSELYHRFRLKKLLNSEIMDKHNIFVSKQEHLKKISLTEFSIDFYIMLSDKCKSYLKGE